MSRAKVCAASGFRPNLHSRAESLSLESLDMSRAVGRESLDIPKFGRKSLDMGRKSLCPNKNEKKCKFLKCVYILMKILRFCYNIFIHLKGQTHVQTFQTQTLGATMQFGSKSGCAATLKVWT